MSHPLLFLAGSEILIIVLAVLLLFGAEAIPGIARTIGKLMNEFHKATDDIKREITDQTSDITKDIGNLKNNLDKKGSDFTRKIDEELK